MDGNIIGIVIRTLIMLLFTFIISKAVKRFFNQEKIKNLIHIKFIKNIIIAVVWIVGISSIAAQFSSLSKLTTTILAGSGIIAAILGLAAQESFSNILSGLFISIFKPFNIGDRIKVSGDNTAGYVEDITLRHTVIRTYMNVRIIIPNSVIGSATIENSTYSKGASYPIDICVAYEDSNKRKRALEIMEEVVIEHPLFYDTRSEEAKEKGLKPVTALCTQCGESGINLRILMWTESIADNPLACSECRLKIMDRFENEGIEIPYNKLKLV